MLARGAACLAALVALGLGACGGDDDEGGGRTVTQPPPPPEASCVPRTTEAARISVRPAWTAGYTRRVTIERSVSRPGPRPPRAAAAGELRVLRAGPARSSLRYSVAPYHHTGLDEIPPEAAARLAEELPGPVVEYATRADGGFLELENVPGLRQQARRVLEATEGMGAEEGLPADAKPRIRRRLESGAQIEQIAIAPLFFHEPYGLVLEPGVPQTRDTAIVSPFGPEPVRATATYELVSAKNENGCAEIEATLVPEPGEVRRSVEAGIRAFAPRVRADRAVLESFDLRADLRFEYDPTNGWIVRAEQDKLSVEFGSQASTERTVIAVQ